MMTASIQYSYPRFDVVEYIKKLRNAGVNQEVAETQAQELEIALNSVLEQSKQDTRQAFENKDLATKGDIAIVKNDIEKVKNDLQKAKLELQKEIAEASTKVIIWVSGLLGTFGICFLGILAKGFHWI